jgi:hypothetical protein
MPNRDKKAGAIVHLVEELGDARLRCDQLVAYVAEAARLVESSPHKDHFFEVAGHLIHAVPVTLQKLQKALQAVALAANQIDSEDLKNDLRPEKVQQIERALEDVRIRQIHRRSEPNMITPEYVAEKLRQIAATTKKYQLPQAEVVRLIEELETGYSRKAASNVPTVDILEHFASKVETEDLDQVRLAATLRRLLGDELVKTTVAAFQETSARVEPEWQAWKTAGARDASEDEKQSRFEEGKPADPTENMSPEDAKEWEENNEKYKDKFKKEAADSIIHAAILKQWEVGRRDAEQVAAKGDADLNESRTDYAIEVMRTDASALKADMRVVEHYTDQNRLTHSKRLFRDLAQNLSATVYWMGYVSRMAGEPGVQEVFDIKFAGFMHPASAEEPPFGLGGGRPNSDAPKPDGMGPRNEGPKTGLGLGPCDDLSWKADSAK